MQCLITSFIVHLMSGRLTAKWTSPSNLLKEFKTFYKTGQHDKTEDVMLTVSSRFKILFLNETLFFQAEEHKRVTRARVEQLKKEMQDLSGAADVIEKVLFHFSPFYSSSNS